jgi:hypothetical protein
MKTWKCIVLPVILALLLLAPSVVEAQQRPPHIFVGTVTINGMPAPAGTKVRALVGGLERGFTTVADLGRYQLRVNSDRSDRITFMVGSLTADQTAVYEQGGADILNLTVNTPGRND